MEHGMECAGHSAWCMMHISLSGMQTKSPGWAGAPGRLPEGGAL